MASATRSTYSVTELGPDGGPVRSYNAIITPYYAGGSLPGYSPPYFPAHPIAPGGGPFPSHPIAPGGEWPAHPGPILPPGEQPPLGIWGPYPGFPTNPISGLPGMPGYEPPKPGEEPKFEWKTGWSPQTGWVVVAIPVFPTPTPSEGSGQTT